MSCHLLTEITWNNSIILGKNQGFGKTYYVPIELLQNCNQNYLTIYNLRCQKYPRHFVRILRWSGATQSKPSFVTFVNQLKMGDHMFTFFPFVSSPWRNHPKCEGHHSIEMLHLNRSEMLFNRNEFKNPYFLKL